MIIFQKIVITLLLLIVITGALFLIFMKEDKAEKILGRILVTEGILFIISLFILIWIY